MATQDGRNEIKSGLYPLKNLATGEEKKVMMEEIAKIVKKKTDGG